MFQLVKSIEDIVSKCLFVSTLLASGLCAYALVKLMHRASSHVANVANRYGWEAAQFGTYARSVVRRIVQFGQSGQSILWSCILRFAYLTLLRCVASAGCLDR